MNALLIYLVKTTAYLAGFYLIKAEADEIIRHEQNNLEDYHFPDILFIEVAKVF
jgi:hypothetical protein